MADDPFWAHRVLFASILCAIVGVEMIVRTVTRGRPPVIPDLSANAFIWLVELAIRAFLIGLRLYVFTLVASFAPIHLPRSIATGCLAYVLIDFLYYWKHR